MTARFGIELSPVACRLVELEGPEIVPGQPPATRVRSYSVLPPSGPEADQAFASIGRRPVAVIVWGARSDHRQVVVPNGSYEKMRAGALAAARTAGADTSGTIADITSASTAIKGANRQPVVLALANADDVSAAIRPLIDARLDIRSVMTPADALLGLARSRKAFAVPGGIEAYVALDATATCVALIRDGSLLSARELPWGFEDSSGAPATSVGAEPLPRRDDLAARLVDELTVLLTAVDAESNALTQVAICGGLPTLRTMTIPLMERLDVEVETLDSLFGIDAEHLPEPADEFRERAAELRLAWAAAADWRGPINLMRHRRRRSRRVMLARAAVVAGVVAGLGAGWTIQQSGWWQSRASATIARRATPAVVPPIRPAPARPNAVRPPQGPAVAVSRPPAPLPTKPPVAPTVTPSQSTSPPTVARAPTALPPVARVTPPVPAAIVPRPSAASTSAVATVAPPPVVTKAPIAAPPVARATPPPVPAAIVPRPSAASTSAVATVAPPPVVTKAPIAAPPVARATPPPVPAAIVPRPSAASTSAVATVAPPPVVTKAPIAAPPVARATPPPVPAAIVPRPSAASTSAVATVAPPPVITKAPIAAPPVARVTPPVVAAPVVRTPVPREEPASAPARVVAPSVVRRPEPPSVPFDAVLGTILYSPDRKLAIVNGRIVGPGDEVNGARIVDITPTTVLLRDAQGRLRNLTLGGRTPPAS